MEQNTERMWWTIGVVVIGGLLIGAAVVLLGDQSTGLLGTVAKKMNELFTQYPAK